MNRGRAVIVFLIVAVLAVDLAVANAAVAADRTVLNPEFVTSTLAEEDAYDQLEPIVLEALPVDELDGAEGEAPPLPVEPSVVMAAALDGPYLKSQVEPNIDRTYAYLHSNADELEVVFDLEPAKAATAEAVESELTAASTAELLESIGGGDGLAFQARGFTFDLGTVAEMADDEAVYRAERAAVREMVRDRVVTTLVAEAFDEATNDERLALVIEDYDPDEYSEAEKAELVEDNEPAIRGELRGRIEAEDDGEIAATVDDQLGELREEIRADATANLQANLGDLDPAVSDPLFELVAVAVDGYTADVSHDEFSSEFEASGDDLAVGMAGLIETEIDEQVPNRMNLLDELDPEAAGGLEDARQVVGIIDLLAMVLPLVGLGLIGSLYLLTRSVATTAIGAGVGVAVGGLPMLVGAIGLRDLLDSLLAGGDLPTGFGALVIAMTDQVATTVLVQSVVVVGVGVAVLGSGLALHFELVELPRPPQGYDAGEQD